MLHQEIAIIGCGAMGSAMAEGLAKSHRLHLFDAHLEKSEHIAVSLKQKAYRSAKEAAEAAKTVIIAVKPNAVSQAADEIKSALDEHKLVISVALNVSLAKLHELFSPACVIRSMPNIACRYNEGMIGLVKGPSCSEEAAKRVEEALLPLGRLCWLSEDKLSALASLSGSGPAFAFMIVESMIDAGIYMGLSAQEAQAIALQMVKGSMKLLESSGRGTSELKWQVTSPAGSTIAGVRKLEEKGLRSALIETFLAVYDQSK